MRLNENAPWRQYVESIAIELAPKRDYLTRRAFPNKEPHFLKAPNGHKLKCNKGDRVAQ